MSESLERRLSAIQLEQPSSTARTRAEEAARRKASSRKAPSRLRMAAAAVVFLGLLAITPPGISLAKSVGDLVGIGDEPSSPLDFGDGKSDQSVIGLSQTPNGTPYELARSDSDVGTKDEFTCFYISYPTVELRPRSASCLTAAALRALRRNPIGSLYPMRAPSALGSQTDLVLTGAVAEEVARLVITFPGENGREEQDLPLSPFSAALRTASGADELEPAVELKVFAAFLPFDLDPTAVAEPDASAFQEHMDDVRSDSRRYETQLRRISLQAFDASGEPIAEVSPGDRRGSAMSLAIGLG